MVVERRQLACTSMATVVPVRQARAVKVSPGWTVYRHHPAGGTQIGVGGGKMAVGAAVGGKAGVVAAEGGPVSAVAAAVGAIACVLLGTSVAVCVGAAVIVEIGVTVATEAGVGVSVGTKAICCVKTAVWRVASGRAPSCSDKMPLPTMLHSSTPITPNQITSLRSVWAVISRPRMLIPLSTPLSYPCATRGAVVGLVAREHQVEYYALIGLARAPRTAFVGLHEGLDDVAVDRARVANVPIVSGLGASSERDVQLRRLGLCPILAPFHKGLNVDRGSLLGDAAERVQQVV